jgi:hypothetical protein
MKVIEGNGVQKILEFGWSVSFPCEERNLDCVCDWENERETDHFLFDQRHNFDLLYAVIVSF